MELNLPFLKYAMTSNDGSESALYEPSSLVKANKKRRSSKGKTNLSSDDNPYDESMNESSNFINYSNSNHSINSGGGDSTSDNNNSNSQINTNVPNSSTKPPRSTRSSTSTVTATASSNSNLQHLLNQQYPNMDPRLLDMKFPKEYENSFATAIFELGLKHSSPKIIIPLMPTTNADLSTEHIKSHLQKYRIHQKRSKEEFEFFYRTHLQDSFHDWEKNRGWETITVPSTSSVANNAITTSSSHSTDRKQEKMKGSFTSSGSSLNELEASHLLSDSDGVWLNESKETGNDEEEHEEDGPARKIRKLQQLKDSLTATMTMIEEIKSLGKMAADDCSRFSKNLQSMINI